VAFPDEEFHGSDEILHMDHCLSMGEVSREQPRRRAPLMDPLNLEGQWKGMAPHVVDLRDPKYGDGDVAALLVQEGFRLELGFRILPPGPEGGVLRDPLPRLTGGMDEHRTRKDEAIYRKGLKPSEAAAGALDSDRVVLRAGLAGEIIVSSEVDHRGDPIPVLPPDPLEGLPDALVTGNVEGVEVVERERGIGRPAAEPQDFIGTA
jgi:hypothetical protein